MITSLANPLVKDLVRLRSRRHRDRTTRFLVEGRREAAAALAAGLDVVTQVVAPGLGGEPLDPALHTVELGDAAFGKVSTRQSPDGVLLVLDHLDTRLERLDPGPETMILVLEGLEKPGNVGAILRTADAVGVDAVVIADPATDVHNPNVVRASQGALFSVPVAVTEVPQVLEWLAARSITLVAASPDAVVPLWDVDLSGSLALAVGSESHGLSAALASGAGRRVVVPMRGSVDSLNASVTAAVLLYEAARQRR